MSGGGVPKMESVEKTTKLATASVPFALTYATARCRKEEWNWTCSRSVTTCNGTSSNDTRRGLSIDSNSRAKRSYTGWIVIVLGQVAIGKRQVRWCTGGSKEVK